MIKRVVDAFDTALLHKGLKDVSDKVALSDRKWMVRLASIASLDFCFDIGINTMAPYIQTS